MENLPTTPNIFLMSGTYIASKTMIILSARVIKEWRVQENGQLENSIIIKAFLAWITEKQRDLGKEEAKYSPGENTCTVSMIFLSP
jgi:hypothetical protein